MARIKKTAIKSKPRTGRKINKPIVKPATVVAAIKKKRRWRPSVVALR